MLRSLKLRMIVRLVFSGVLPALAFSLTCAAPVGTTRPAGVVVSISDIHFDPFHDPKLVASLIQSDYTGWQAIFSHSGVQGYGSHSADTSYNLLNSALQNNYLRAPHPDFIVISGDFLAHDFQKTFAKLSGSNDPKALASFIDKT